MSPLARRRLWGGGFLLLAALAGAAWLLRLDRAEKISTDVLDLIPATERAPELTLVRQLASHAEARTMLFELTLGGKPAPREAAAKFAARLQENPAIAEAVALGDGAMREEIGRVVYEERLVLLFPGWLERQRARHAAQGGNPAAFTAWLAEERAKALEQFLSTPEAVAFQEIVAADPLLLTPELTAELRGGLSLVTPAAGGAEPPALVWARLAASPLSEEGQAPVFAAIEEARAELDADFAGLAVAYTGINRFAAASRALIEREVAVLNSLSVIAVLLVAFTFIRRVHRGLHLVPVILLSILGAWTFTTLAFERVHILVFVVGSLLTGVAIDYGFYLFMQPTQPGEDYWDKVRRLAKPLLASCFTTVAGFALLLFSELPLIRQLGVFVGSGLLAALTAAVIYFSTVRNCFLETRAFRGGRALPEPARRWARRGLIALWAAALPGLFLLTWRDDVRELEIPSPELRREDARLRALFGDRGERSVYLSYGATVDEARESLRTLEQWLRAVGGSRVELANLGPMVPGAAQAEEAFAFLGSEFPDLFRTALVNRGFEPDEFRGFFDELARHAHEGGPAMRAEALQRLRASLTGPLSLLWHEGESLSWFVTLVQHAPGLPPPAATQSVAASQLQSLNRVFARYRETAVWFSLGGLALVGGGVFLTYGWRAGLRIFAIPCGTCLGVFGALGWIGIPLNLFHLLGAFLGVCLMHNYSIFSATSAFRHETPPASVRLSALTTSASFGVLALSDIPVVHALGLTVALMVLGALAIIELEHLAPLARKRHG